MQGGLLAFTRMRHRVDTRCKLEECIVTELNPKNNADVDRYTSIAQQRLVTCDNWRDVLYLIADVAAVKSALQQLQSKRVQATANGKS